MLLGVPMLSAAGVNPPLSVHIGGVDSLVCSPCRDGAVLPVSVSISLCASFWERRVTRSSVDESDRASAVMACGRPRGGLISGAIVMSAVCGE